MDDAKGAAAQAIAVAVIPIKARYQRQAPRHGANERNARSCLDAWIRTDEVKVLAIRLIAHGQHNAPGMYQAYSIASSVLERDATSSIDSRVERFRDSKAAVRLARHETREGTKR
jgi:hypothetical protein